MPRRSSIALARTRALANPRASLIKASSAFRDDDFSDVLRESRRTAPERNLLAFARDSARAEIRSAGSSGQTGHHIVVSRGAEKVGQ